MTCSSCNHSLSGRKTGVGCRKAAQIVRRPVLPAGCLSRAACASSCTGCSPDRPSASARYGASACRRPFPGQPCFHPVLPHDPCRPHDPCHHPVPCHPQNSGCSCLPETDACYPYYCGPAHPVFGCADGCGCDPCAESCTDPCPGCYYAAPVYGYFTQVGSLNVTAGGVIPFNGGSTVEGIWKDGGAFTLEEEGVYLATLTARSPADTALSTELSVRVNGIVNPGGTITFASEATDPPQSASAQTILTVNSGAVVTVTSSEALTLTPENVTDPLVTLTLIKIG